MNKSKAATAEHSPKRRRFLKLAGAAAVGGAALSVTGLTAAAQPAFEPNPSWPEDVLWKKVRDAFVLDSHSVYMNIGTTGSVPGDVLDNYDAYNRLVAADPWEDIEKKYPQSQKFSVYRRTGRRHRAPVRCP